MSEGTSELPALTHHRYLRFAAFAALYAAQGLPWGMFLVAIPAWAAGKGYTAADIGSFIAIAALPWSFKLVAGPLMDRFTFLRMGRRRPWVLGAQAGIIMGLLVLAAAPDFEGSLMPLAWLGFLINSFCALQDVAVDGMAIDILPENERARANAFMYGGQLAGISASSSAGTWLLSVIGLDAAALVLAASVLIIMQVPLFLRERPGESLLPWTTGEPAPESAARQSMSIGSVFKDVLLAIFLPMSLLLVLVEFLNRASGGILVAIGPIVTVQDAGWADTQYGNWQATAGIAAAVFGVLVAPLVDKYGAGRALGAIVAIRIAMFAIVGLFPDWWTVDGFFQTFIITNALTSQIVTIAFMALFMAICAPRVAATQFAVYMASANLALSAGSGIVALVDPLLDNAGMFLLAAAMNLLLLAVWPLFDMRRHERRVGALGLT